MKAAAEENNQAQENIVIKAACAECDEATARLRQLIGPIEVVRATRARVSALKFPTPERERSAAQIVAGHSKPIDELIRNSADLNSIRSKCWEMEQACRRLTIPEKAPSFSDELHRTHNTFRQASWSEEEMDGLKASFHDGDRINAIAISSVKLGEREVLRSDVRGMLKGLVTNARLDEIERRERDALQFEAENKHRRKTGPAREPGDLGLASGGQHHRHW
jgi:hypothetical protein